jgi:hypothetical protein
MFRRHAASATVGLAVAAAAGAAQAETITVSISSAAVSIGNLVITSSPASVKVTAGTGEVSIVSGGAVRIKAAGAAPGAAPVQTVTVQCVGGAGNCKNTYNVLITQAAVAGQAASVSRINVANLTVTQGSATFSSAPEAAPGQIFTITGGSNNFTATFALGSTVVLNAGAGHTASWSYNVRVTP